MSKSSRRKPCLHTLPRVHGGGWARLPLGFALELNPRLLCCHALLRVAMMPQGRVRDGETPSLPDVATTCGSRWKHSSLWLRH